MILAFDLDGVICSRPKNLEHLGVEKYKYCYPIKNMVNIVNECYEKGHYIKIYTSRGMSIFSGDVTKIYSELFELTNNCLQKWQIKYHELILCKIHYDLLIDDKSINSSYINSIEDIEKLTF